MGQKLKYIQDWFGFYPEWLVGVPAINFVLYFITFVGFIPGSENYLYWLAYLSNAPAIILLTVIFVPLGFVWRNNKIVDKLKDEYSLDPTWRVTFALLWEIMAAVFGILYALAGLFTFTIKDPTTYWLATLSILTFPNTCSIISRGWVKESPIVEYIINKLRKIRDRERRI